MPPGPAFNWFCVAHSVVSVLSNAAHIRATQISARSAPLVIRTSRRSTPRQRENQASELESPLRVQDDVPQSTLEVLPSSADTHTLSKLPPISQSTSNNLAEVTEDIRSSRHEFSPTASRPTVSENESHLTIDPLDVGESPSVLGKESAIEDAPVTTGIPEPAVEHVMYTIGRPLIVEPSTARKLQPSKVPSSRIGRLFHYGGLAASLGYGAASELLRRSTSSGETTSPSLMLTEGNIKRLVSKLTQLRGAALKLGQFMSIQDSHGLPPEIEDIFRRVQDSAHYMPDWQMEEVLCSSLGPSWADYFESFDRLPFAAASIGQVHSAVLSASSSPTGQPAKVAVKIQFPNIAHSIESDLGYLKMLLTAGRLLPKGLFLDRTIQVMKGELADECDYSREASFLRRFASPSFLGDDSHFKVPWVWEGSTERILVMEHVDGLSVGGSVSDSLSHRDRDDIAARIIELCLKELFVFRLMQTDPNWTNFLWNSYTRQIELVDFGATREYSKEFIDNWLRVLQAAISGERDACIDWSLKLGYLTGEENEIMLDAHVKSMTLLATPFKADTPQPVTFGPGSQWADITAEIRTQIPIMLKHRLTPPPRETYSLNRKLSGAFLLAARLDASVDCKALWDQTVENYQFGAISTT
ncbi:hypothetical protein AcV5_010063 [Taiwanofungus camphoratus]|nr:hypothetical protein AcV5_010063 [Antrodia cinnamomea]